MQLATHLGKANVQPSPMNVYIKAVKKKFAPEETLDPAHEVETQSESGGSASGVCTHM